MTQQQKTLTRREFVQSCAAMSLGFVGLQLFTSGQLAAAPKESIGYGPLVKDSKGILNLPKGFSYQIISRQGERMSDGLLVPGKPDGMAAFVGNKGRTIVVRNHEVIPESTVDGAFGIFNELLSKADKDKFYDYGKGELPGLGGTTTLVYDPRSKKVECEYLSLAGTIRNCAGGPTPWNSWITCEETVRRARGHTEKDHGYNFEVPARESVGLTQAVALKEMGRFNHEAVAVDPRTGIVYQTEDRSDGLIYRFIPNVPGELAQGGKLQALVIKGHKSFDSRNWDGVHLPVGKKVAVEWLDLDGIDSPDDDLRYRGFAAGACRFARGEGMWFGDSEMYFACTNGGQIQSGQVFRYVPSSYEGQAREQEVPGKLELFIEPNNTKLLENCDNLTISPWGDVIVAEDRSHPFLVGVTPQGELYKLAENVGFDSEFAGVTFAPSGETLFVNIQHAGLTLAITGPWKS